MQSVHQVNLAQVLLENKVLRCNDIVMNSLVSSFEPCTSSNHDQGRHGSQYGCATRGSGSKRSNEDLEEARIETNERTTTLD